MTNPEVTVTSGIFTVNLDFGAARFDGATDFWRSPSNEMRATKFTILTPRQKITSAPYSIRALSAAQADLALDSNKLGGIDATNM